MKSNLAHELQKPQGDKQCYLCEVTDDNAFYFQSEFSQLICFKCMASNADWYFKYVSDRFVQQEHEASFQRKINNHASKRYTKKKISQTLRMKVYERDGFKCVTCSKQTNLSLDHIKPEVLGGEATLENLQTMCKSCNSRKGARYVEASN
jgi:5-methylcytosine-specific restriction endonuclease McrA